MRALIASFLVAMLAGTACAAEESACYVASHLVQADFALPRVAAAIEAKHLKIVVLGSTSSTLPGDRVNSVTVSTTTDESDTTNNTGSTAVTVNPARASLCSSIR